MATKKQIYQGVKLTSAPPTLAEEQNPNILKKNVKTFPMFSQMCLPGGPKSADYDPDTYVYPSSYSVGDGIQPGILAIEGDTQVGALNYSTSSLSTNHNRSKTPLHHTITEKAFYTELDNVPIRTNRPEWAVPSQKTFLRVDLTEGNKVFRHNAVLVKGTVHCVNQRVFSLNDGLSNPDNVFALYDFESYFVCNPLTSHTTGLNYTDSEGRLSTLSTYYFYLRNRSFNVNNTLADQELGDINFHPPVLTSWVAPMQNWAEFALKSETGAVPGGINLVPEVLWQYTNNNIQSVTPVQAGRTLDENDKWDLNFVNFKIPLPDTNFPLPNARFKRFAIKGTYLLI